MEQVLADAKENDANMEIWEVPEQFKLEIQHPRANFFTPGLGGVPFIIPSEVCRMRGDACNRRYPGALAEPLKKEQTCRKCGNDVARPM